MVWCFKSCGKCGGDLMLEEDVWRCWQCGHYYYPSRAEPVEAPSQQLDGPDRVVPGGHGRVMHRGGYGGRAGRNINAVVDAKNISDERWIARNQQVIAFLDEGRTVGEIALLTAMGRRQIRVVREKLADLKMGDEYIHLSSGGQHDID